MSERLVSARELARRLGCSERSVYNYLRRRVLRVGVYRFRDGQTRYLRFDPEVCRAQLEADGRIRPRI